MTGPSACLQSDNLPELRPRETSSEIEDDEASEDQFRERRAATILNQFKKLRSHLASAKSLMHEERDPAKTREWVLDIDLACRRARSKAGLRNVNTLIESLTARNPAYGAQFTFMLDSFLSEMDRLNRLGTPDDYDDEWGTDAAERYERERMMRYMRTISGSQKVEMRG